MDNNQAAAEKPASRLIEFRIERFKPGLIDPPRFQSFRLQVTAGMSVLDCLEQIRLTRDETLLYRHSCHHSACGTCACTINGIQRLACTTSVLELDTDIVVLEPLHGFTRLGDLVVDMTGFYRDIDPDWAVLRFAEPVKGAAGDSGVPLRLEDCIECGCCVVACPVVHSEPCFLGPAALAALNNQIRNRPALRADLLTVAAADCGEKLCDRTLNCSRVCPTQVYPARHIAELRRAVAQEGPD